MDTKLTRYSARWQLLAPRHIATTPTSTVYVVTWHDQRAILKLLTPLGIKDEAAGIVALRHYNGNGAVRLYEHTDDALLMEYAEGPPLTSLVIAGKDVEAAQTAARVINQLHIAQPGITSTGLKPLSRWFRSLFRRAEGQSGGDSELFEHAATVARQLLEIPTTAHVLHGDIHHENIRYKEGRGWLAFDPKGLYGDRAFDAANMLLNPVNMNELVANEARILRNIDAIADVMDIDALHLRRHVFAYACLSASWSLEDGDEAASALRVARMIRRHLR